MEWNGRVWKDVLRVSMVECLLGIMLDVVVKYVVYDVVKLIIVLLFGR